MNRITLVAIAIVSALLTPVVVNAAGRTEEATKPVVVAQAATVSQAVSEPAAAPASDGCTRRVRVVYAAAYQIPNGDCAARTASK